MFLLLAETNNFGDTRDGGLAGPTGLVIILLLAVGTVFLVRSMNARLRKLPERFPAQPPPDADQVDEVDTTAGNAK